VKRFLILLALAATVAAGVSHDADAQVGRRLATSGLVRWVVADGAGGTRSCCDTTSIVYTSDQTADNRDTTEWVDLSQFKLPPKLVANDSTTVIYAYVTWDTQSATDTMYVQPQYGTGGVIGSAGTGSITSGLVQTIVQATAGQVPIAVASYRLTNQFAAADGARMIRWIVTNIDNSQTRVRVFRVQPFAWVNP
jgi:hypothetical protein